MKNYRKGNISSKKWKVSCKGSFKGNTAQWLGGKSRPCNLHNICSQGTWRASYLTPTARQKTTAWLPTRAVLSTGQTLKEEELLWLGSQMSCSVCLQSSTSHNTHCMNASQISVLCSKASLGNYSLSQFSCFHSDMVIGSLTKIHMKLCAFLHVLHHSECHGWKSNTNKCNLLTILWRLDKTPKTARSSCSPSTTKPGPQVPPSHIFLMFPGEMFLPLPWAAVGKILKNKVQ